MIKISGLKVPLNYDTDFLFKLAAKKLKIDEGVIKNLRIVRRATNNKDKSNIYFNMDIVVELLIDEQTVTPLKYDDNISKEMNFTYLLPTQKKLSFRPAVVGCGPAGMFAALILAEAGAKPILIERGLDVDNRKKKVSAFFKNGALDENTNVQFGEGGAGTFSDGKLKIGSKDYRKIKVLREYINAGAPSEIIYLEKPHIGTDNLSVIVKKIRNKIISLGGEVVFGAKVTEIYHKNGSITGLEYEKDSEANRFDTEAIVLAIGHSARDTYEMLLRDNIKIEQKNIAVGVRIEHPQSLIDKIEYGNFAGNPALGAASYKLVVHLENGRAVYSFCMCPGGEVVASASEKETIVTNGMSEFRRDGKNANTALLVTVSNKDFGSNNPLAGVVFQRNIEKAAFCAAGSSYKAPVIRLEDFLNKSVSKAFGDVLPTYPPGTEFALPDDYLPGFVCDSLRDGVKEMEAWMPGYYYPDALLTGAETRSSSPVKIPRTETLEAVGISGLYPCGEGAGYSGGIISSAVDGVMCAEMILALRQ